MPIKSIEMICVPCTKCNGIEDKIRNMIKAMEQTKRIKIPFEFKHTMTLKNISTFSLNASQTPVIIINGNVEFAGKLDLILLRRKLETIQGFC